MEIDQLFGLPAHPLLVHMPVVFIPLTLRWRSPRSPGPGGAGHQPGRGRSRDDRHAGRPDRGDERRASRGARGETDLIEQHAELGEAARTFAILVFLIAVVYAAREWRGRAPLPGIDACAA